MAQGESKIRTPKAPRVTVEVTADLIRDSELRSSSHCMIAEAIRAAYPDAQKVAIDVQTIRFSDMKKGQRYVYLTPRIAQMAIINFDQGTLPEPYRFRLSSGQVCRAGRRPVPRNLSAAEMSQRQAAQVGAFDQLAKAQLVDRDPGCATREGGQKVPDRVGGKPPPVSIAMRREFGLRAFDRLK